MSKYKIYAAPRIVAHVFEMITDEWLPEHLVVIYNGEDTWVLNLNTGYLRRYADPLTVDSDIKEETE